MHLLFSGEKIKQTQLEPRPRLRPIRVGLHGQDFLVIPVANLVQMKLSSYRDKDRVHIPGMDAAGLITQDVESTLNDALQSKLHHIRATE